jgi:hypothetical protein
MAVKSPTFRALLASNLRVCAYALLVAAVVYWTWRLLRYLFPEVQWLQLPPT